MDTGRRKPMVLSGRHALGGIYLNLTHYGRLGGKKLVGLQFDMGFFAFGVAAAYFTVLTSATDCNRSFSFSSSRRQAIWATLGVGCVAFSDRIIDGLQDTQPLSYSSIKKLP
jgi:hypothetical protein